MGEEQAQLNWEERIETDIIVSRNREMKALSRLLNKVSPQPVTILIEGESGTRKERIARAIHRLSNRSSKPFIAANMGAIPENLMESLLFVHERGAFTGAVSLQRGKFELAHEGTLFLDEIADLPANLQPKLLRSLQEGSIERLGGERLIPVDVRLVVATNRNLEKMVAAGEFREDLYYRFHVVPIKLPPLRHHKEDIAQLVRSFFARCNKKFGKSIIGISQEVQDLFEKYSWPGNIRELEHLCERIAVTSDSDVITLKDLPEGFGRLNGYAPQGAPLKIGPLDEASSDFERQYLEAALRAQNWHQGKTADTLGIHRKTLEGKMKKYGLSRTLRTVAT